MKKNFKSAVNVLQNSFGLGGFGRPGRPHAAEKAKCRPRVEFRCSRLQLSGAAGDPLRLSGWGGASRVQVAPRARSALARSRGRPVHPAASGRRGARRRVPVLEAVTLVGGIGPPETCAWTPTLRPSPHSRLSAGRLGGIRAGRATGHICGGVRGRLHGGRLTASGGAGPWAPAGRGRGEGRALRHCPQTTVVPMARERKGRSQQAESEGRERGKSSSPGTCRRRESRQCRRRPLSPDSANCPVQRWPGKQIQQHPGERPPPPASPPHCRSACAWVTVASVPRTCSPRVPAVPGGRAPRVRAPRAADRRAEAAVLVLEVTAMGLGKRRHLQRKWTSVTTGRQPDRRGGRRTRPRRLGCQPGSRASARRPCPLRAGLVGPARG